MTFDDIIVKYIDKNTKNIHPDVVIMFTKSEKDTNRIDLFIKIRYKNIECKDWFRNFDKYLLVDIEKDNRFQTFLKNLIVEFTNKVIDEALVKFLS
jgi:hypothetical protein